LTSKTQYLLVVYEVINNRLNALQMNNVSVSNADIVSNENNLYP